MNKRAMERLQTGLPNDPVVWASTTTYQLIKELSHERVFVSNLAGTVTWQLPIATGSGVEITFVVGTNSAGQTTIVQRGVSTDRFQGSVFIGIDASTSGKAFKASTTTNANTLTLNGTTQGGVSVGDLIYFIDILSGIWAVQGTVIGSGSIATPFSNT